MSHKAQTLSRIEERLRHHQEQLEKSMTSVVAQGRESTTDETRDVADQAVHSYQKELLFRQSTSGHEQLSLVRLALERLHEGTYGECIHCGKTIGVKRLEALPWTASCIECQEKIERGELENSGRAA